LFSLSITWQTPVIIGDNRPFLGKKYAPEYTLEAGLPEHLRHEHCLKHSCATHLLAKGADVIVVKDWLGHRDIRSTMEYAQIRNAQRDAAAAKVYLQG
jgi:site-specific recombinase XerD